MSFKIITSLSLLPANGTTKRTTNKALTISQTTLQSSFNFHPVRRLQYSSANTLVSSPYPRESFSHTSCQDWGWITRLTWICSLCSLERSRTLFPHNTSVYSRSTRMFSSPLGRRNPATSSVNNFIPPPTFQQGFISFFSGSSSRSTAAVERTRLLVCYTTRYFEKDISWSK